MRRLNGCIYQSADGKVSVKPWALVGSRDTVGYEVEQGLKGSGVMDE